jgi:16S rRNA (adenine1518-N6/adenine1519-N6)-dimethyltransferase
VGTRDAGAITVGVNYFGTVKNLFGVSRGNFMPSPNVDSAVIRIDVNKDTPLKADEEKFFFSVVKSGFSQRRKTLANALSSQMNTGKQEVYDALSAIGLPETARIEQIDMENLINFSMRLMRNIRK